MSTASQEAYKQRQQYLDNRPKYPNKVRPEHLHIGNFVHYTDPRKDPQRDTPALILDVSINGWFSEMRVLFLDTLEQVKIPLGICSEPEHTFSEQRSFMRATPREKAVAYVNRRFGELNAEDPAKSAKYLEEAQSFGLI